MTDRLGARLFKPKKAEGILLPLLGVRIEEFVFLEIDVPSTNYCSLRRNPNVVNIRSFVSNEVADMSAWACPSSHPILILLNGLLEWVSPAPVGI